MMTPGRTGFVARLKEKDAEVAVHWVGDDAVQSLVVDHKQTALNNLKAAAKGLLDTIDPTSTVRPHLKSLALVAANKERGIYSQYLPAWLWVPAAIVDKLLQPFGVIKDLGEATISGAKYGAQALFQK